jgi:hypothetical protein
MTTYRCTTRLVVPLAEGDGTTTTTPGHHLVIDHKEDSDLEAEAKLLQFRKKLRRMEVS